MEIPSSIRALLSSSEATSPIPRVETRDSQSLLLNGRQAFSLLMGGEPTASGETINERTSLQISWVYACVRVIAETAGALPVRIYEDLGNSEQEAKSHSLSYLLSVEPNPEMTAPVLFETMAGCLALTGNAYVEIIRDKRGNVVQLYPRDPLQTEPQRNDAGVLEYLCTENNQRRIIAAANMIHVPLWGWNGLRGLSPVHLQSQSLGFAQATLKQGARFIGNGFAPSGIVTPDGAITPEQGKQIISTLEQQASGTNQGRPVVLPAPMKFSALGMSMTDAAFFESRSFSRNEIAAMFRLDPHHIGDTTRQSNANAEQASLNLIQETMQPYLTKIATELNRKLLPMTGRKRSSYVIRFDLTERLKADLKTTLETLALGRQWSLLKVDEGRKQLGLNPIGGELGDSLMAPINMLEAEQWLAWSPSKPAPTTEPTK